MCRDFHYKTGGKEEKIGFRWTGSTWFSVKVPRVVVKTEEDLSMAIISENDPRPYAMDDSGTSHVFLDEGLLPADARGRSTKIGRASW